MLLNAFHITVIVIAILNFSLISLVIFLKVKNLQASIACYCINFFATLIISYSLFITIDEHTIRAEVSDVSFTRNLRTETVLVRGRVTNLTKYPIQKCYLKLSIVNKLGASDDVFKQNQVRNTQGQQNSVHYNLLISDTLEGHTYKDFDVRIPFPPGFTRAEFYHTTHCI